ncbi:MAG: hypothetical protein Q8L86_14505 [Vicinamibacterales bacterium]|nr:hypothetical protein [Vicinamibacterales bacterium]
MPQPSSSLEPSPAAGAIGFAALVVLVALLGYIVTAALDDWPALMLATLGAMLGASFATTRIVGYDLDPRAPAALPDGWTPRVLGMAVATSGARAGVRRGMHLAILALAASVQVAGWLEEPRVLVLTLGLGGLWYTLFRAVVELASPPERPGDEPPPAAEPPDSVFPPLFQMSASALALGLLYLAIATDTPWLWRPTIWDHFQGPLLFILLEAVSAPVAAIAGRRS